MPQSPSVTEFSPANPSAEAVARVGADALPVPASCRYCQHDVHLVNNKEIYKRSYGEWPYAYLCSSAKCGAFVGLHPLTAIPLGTLANEELRGWRVKAKNVFNPLWQKGPRHRMTRKQAYAWLSEVLGLPRCHVGWLEIEQCKQVFNLCQELK